MCTEIIHSNLLTQTILAAIYEERAEADWERKDSDGASKDFAKSLDLYPDFAAAHANRGYMLKELGRPDDAAADFERSGYFYLKQDKCDHAVMHYNEALQIDPKIAAALYGRGLCEQRDGKNDAAKADMDAALALDPAIAQSGNWPSGN